MPAWMPCCCAGFRPWFRAGTLAPDSAQGAILPNIAPLSIAISPEYTLHGANLPNITPLSIAISPKCTPSKQSGPACVEDGRRRQEQVAVEQEGVHQSRGVRPARICANRP